MDLAWLIGDFSSAIFYFFGRATRIHCKIILHTQLLSELLASLEFCIIFNYEIDRAYFLTGNFFVRIDDSD
jgi:hypothetical protein